MLKAYAIGFACSVLAIVVVAGIWFFTQPEKQPGLEWGGTVYTTKQEFNGYLRSRGLAYKTWLARNPGVAPWEPRPRAAVAAPAGTSRPAATRPSLEPEGEGGSSGLPLTTIALMLVTGVAVLLFLRTGAATALAGAIAAHGRRASPPREVTEPRREAPDPIEQLDRPPQRVAIRPVERVLRPAVAARGGPAAADVEPPPRVVPVRAEPASVEILAPRPRPDVHAEQEAVVPEASRSEMCEIRLWRGYLKSQFYVETGPPRELLIESRSFRARGSGEPEQSDEAVAAYVALVEALVFAGWKQDGRGAHWYSDRFLGPAESSA